MKCLNKSLPFVSSIIEYTGSEALTASILNDFREDYTPTMDEIEKNIENRKLRLREFPNKKSLTNRLDSFLREQGIKLETSERIDLKGNPKGTIDFLNGILTIAEDKDSSNFNNVLIEESAHVAVELLRQNSSPLYSSMMNEVNRYKEYEEVVKQYGEIYDDIPSTRGFEGKSKEQRLREEAIGKIMAKRIKGISISPLAASEVTEKANQRIDTWFGRVKSFIKDLIGIEQEQFSDIFSLAVKETIYSDGKAKVLRPLQRSNNILFSLEEKKKDFDWKSILSNITNIDSRLIKKEIEGVTKYVLDGTKVISKRVTETVKKKADDKKYDDKGATIYTDTGTMLHEAMENVINRYTQKRSGAKEISNKSSNVNEATYDRIESFIHSILKDPRFDNATLLTELQVYDSVKDMAGTLDLVILDKFGVAHIIDWKFVKAKFDKKGARKTYNPSKTSTSEWERQMDAYKDILSKRYNIKEFGYTRMIPIEVEYSGEKGEEKFNQVFTDTAGIKGVFTENAVPSRSESTGDDNYDKLVNDLQLQADLINKNSSYTDLAKRERLNFLERAIRKIRVKQDLAPFLKNATFEIKRIEDDISADKISPDKLVEVMNRIAFYKNLGYLLGSKNEESVQNNIQKLTNAANVMESKLYGSKDNPTSKMSIWKATNGIDYSAYSPVGKFLHKVTTMQNINNPVFRLLATKIRESNDLKDNKVREYRDRLESIVKNIKTWDRLLETDAEGKQTGSLIKQHKAEYREKLEGATIAWLEKNTKIRETVTVEGKQINTKEYFEKQLEEHAEFVKVTDPENYDFRIKEYRRKNDFWDTAYRKEALKRYSEKKAHFYVQASDDWFTDKYKWVKDNPDSPEAKSYDIFQDIIQDARELTGEKRIYSDFIPSYNKHMLEIAANLDFKGLKNAIVDSYSLEDYEVNRILERTTTLAVPKELGNTKELDLAAVFLTFSDSVYHSKHMKDTEKIANLGRLALERGSYIKSNRFWEAMDSNGSQKKVSKLKEGDYVMEVDDTVKAFNDFIDSAVFRVADVKDYRIPGTKNGSSVKAAQTAIKFNSILGIGGNLLSIGANFFGAVVNQTILATGGSRYFTGSSLRQSFVSLGQGSGKDKQLRDLFDVTSAGNVKNWSKRVSIKKITAVTSDLPFFGQRAGDWVTQNGTLGAFIRDNTFDTETGKTRRTREGEKSIYEQFEESKSGEELTNPFTIEQVNLIRNKVKEINSEVTGSLNDGDILTARNNVVLQAMMQYKTWMIPMAKARFGSLSYNTNLQDYQEGRFRTFFGTIVSGLTSQGLQFLPDLMTGNFTDKDYYNDILRKRYNDYIELNPNFSPDSENGLSFEEYKEINLANIKASVAELIFAASLVSTVLYASSDDEDNDEMSTIERVIAENLGRYSQELTFWLDPMTIIGTLTDNTMPVTGLLNNTWGLLRDTSQQLFGVAFFDDELMKKAKPLKYAARLTPMFKFLSATTSPFMDETLIEQLDKE